MDIIKRNCNFKLCRKEYTTGRYKQQFCCHLCSVNAVRKNQFRIRSLKGLYLTRAEKKVLYYICLNPRKIKEIKRYIESNLKNKIKVYTTFKRYNLLTNNIFIKKKLNIFLNSPQIKKQLK